MRVQMSVALSVMAALQCAEAASIFDLIGSSVSSLVTNQEEAPYTVVRTEKDYEVRNYSAQRWVCKTHSGLLTTDAQEAAFLSLFDYLAGENDAGVTIKMSTPVSIRAPGDSANAVYEACFWPGSSYQTNTPVPTNTELYIRSRPQMTVFTRKFGGYARQEEAWRSESSALTKVLLGAAENINDNHYFWNAFDSPIKFWNRRNEVWILKKE